jgi:hypothetical protein
MVVQARTGGAVDESEPVSDADFGAIAAAAAADRHNAATRARASAAAAKPQQPKPAPRTEQPVAKAQPPAPSRAPAADRALDHVKPSRTPGLGASLGASPVAPLLANLVDTPKQPAFDARQMSAATLATLPAVTAGRGAGALRELASRAPGEVFVAQAEAEKKRKQDAALAEKRPAPVVVAEKPRVQPAPKPIAAAPERKPAPAPVAPPVPDAARPGNIGSGAEAFAQKRTLAASDLSLDFLSPEVLQAARAYGFGPIDAARAQRLAASGRPRITDLASQVDQVFVSALSAPPAAAARTAAKPEPPVARDEKKPEPALAKQPVAPQPQPQQPLREAAPLRTPRGAFLLPEASARALGVSGKGAEEARPDIRFALDLVAAGHVADAATSRAAPPDTKAPASAASERPPALPVLARERGEDDRRDPNEARALLPRELWPVFDVVFLSLGESSSSGADGRPLAPAARAARALALTSKSRDGGDLPLSARARAAAAWAVLPTVIHGGPGRDRDRSGATPGATAARAPTARPVVSGDTPRFEAPRIDTTLRAGESLGSLVAPSFYEADGNRGLEDRPRAQQAQARMQSQSSREMPSTPVVQTGATPQQQRQAEPPPRQEPAPAPRPTQPRHYSSQPTPPGGDVPAWFQDAARKYLGDSGAASGGMSLAELTLVTAAPATQVAASSTRADRPVSQAESTSSSGAAGGSSPAAQQAETKADIDKIAQEVFEQICRMLEVARERSGDPWQR